MNPTSSATPPSVPAPDINPPEPHELAKLFGQATETEVDLADFILLAAMTGARRSELVALRWTDLDLDRATVWIKRGIVTGFTGLVEKDTKNHAARRVSLDPTTVAALAARRDRAVERARACEHELDAGAFVFSNEVDVSKSWYPDSVSRAFARLCRKAGIKGVRLRLHDLRHYAVHQVAVRAALTCAPSPGGSATGTRRRR